MESAGKSSYPHCASLVFGLNLRHPRAYFVLREDCIRSSTLWKQSSRVRPLLGWRMPLTLWLPLSRYKYHRSSCFQIFKLLRSKSLLISIACTIRTGFLSEKAVCHRWALRCWYCWFDCRCAYYKVSLKQSHNLSSRIFLRLMLLPFSSQQFPADRVLKSSLCLFSTNASQSTGRHFRQQ